MATKETKCLRCNKIINSIDECQNFEGKVWLFNKINKNKIWFDCIDLS